MRCPKCRYISFERVERCRNCGYDFSLAASATADEPELPIRDASSDPLGPMTDLALADRSREADAPAVEAEVLALRGVPGRITDLPLFGGPTPAPRAPLAVRRSTAVDTAEPGPRRVESHAPRRFQPREAPRLALEPPLAPVVSAREAETDVDGAPASAPRRLAAGAIDGAISLAIDLGVLYLTLRLCGLGFGDTLQLPLVPFVGFLFLLNGGYAAAFTAASGQTIGKMAAGIKVVGAAPGDPNGGDRVSFSAAALRTAAYLASALPLGLGFLPGLIGTERLALHDRLAETRVVRAAPAV